MRGLDLGRRFGGIVAWDSFFHLNAEDQRATVPIFARHLAPGGALLFTSGPGAARPSARSRDCRSITPACRRPDTPPARSERADARAFVAEDPDCDLHSVWLAQGGS